MQSLPLCLRQLPICWFERPMFVPVPLRAGLNPTRLVLPHDADSVARYPTALAYLIARFPDDAALLMAKIGAGEVFDSRGEPVTADSPYEPRGSLYLYRDPPVDEPLVPELDDLVVLHRDENLLVVDKPHNVATMPRGRWITQTVLVHLRHTLELPDLSLVHRLDRLTAGMLLLTVRPQVRGAYQLLFERRQVAKEYEAVAPLPSPSLTFPQTVRSRIVKQRGVLAAMEVPGEPNAESLIDLAARDVARGLGLYRLEPRTGKTHQLRLHMASLGLPILNDPFFSSTPPLGCVPGVTARTEVDESATATTGDGAEVSDMSGPPLQLLARSVSFADPLTGEYREFRSRRQLAVWAADRAVPGDVRGSSHQGETIGE